MFAKTCKICQLSKKGKTIYGHLPPKNTEELKPRYGACRPDRSI